MQRPVVGDDLVQIEVMHRSLDRFGPHGGVIPYSCMDAITFPEGDPSRKMSGYKEGFLS